MLIVQDQLAQFFAESAKQFSNPVSGATHHQRL